MLTPCERPHNDDPTTDVEGLIVAKALDVTLTCNENKLGAIKQALDENKKKPIN